MKRFAIRCSILFPTCLAIALFARPLRADDEIAGRVLFNEAMRLASNGQLEKACPKFTESLRQNYNINAHFFLADCWERQGKTATAWTTFLSVATRAKDMRDERRELAARKRANALESRLVRLRVIVTEAIDGLDVRRNGNPVGVSMWGLVIPIDPGDVEVTASAPGFESVTEIVSATEPGKIVDAVVPALSRRPMTSSPPVEAFIDTPQSPVTELAHARNGTARRRDERSGYIRKLGFAGGGLGLAVAAVGGVLALSAKISFDAARTNYGACSDAPCADHSLRLERDAISRANLATGLLIGGAIGTAGGLAVVLAQPRNEKEPSLSVRLHQTGMSLNGSF